MKIGIEAERANHPTKTGVEHYAKQLILHLSFIDTENEYILYLRTKPEQWLLELPKNFKVKVMPFPIFWTQLRISLEMLLHPVDVLFIPASSMPIIHPRKTVVTVHDLAFMFFPESYTWFTRNFHKFEDFLVKLFAWKIIAVSESTKKDFVKFYKVKPDRVFVVHHGYEKRGANRKEIAVSLDPGSESGMTPETQDIRNRLPEKYVLFLSTIQPRKNLEALIDAFRRIREEYPEITHKLVIVGKPGWKFEPILEKIERNRDILVYLNYLPDDERWYALEHASLLVLPSLYEGFGMQILESFEVGTPVATSNVSSMPEVAGDAAIYFDPKDTTDMKKAIAHTLLDKGLCDSLVEKGHKRLEQFSWEKCTRETLQVLAN